ncbi:MAG: hypothetical protein ACN4G0_02190 [Polyangiales bacterium]
MPLSSSRWAFVTNLLLLGFLGAFAWLEANYPNAYYRSVQEDEALEWASFWSFLIAGVVFAVAARRQRKTTHTFPWFLLGLALFCVFVAVEEISWGQRVFGHRPPDYFLAQNYQQELNLHNIASTGLRLFAFRGVVLGYGVLLPLFGLVPFVRRLFDRFAIVPPPAELAPSMLAMFWIHSAYPWKFTGEVVEGALGVGFLFAALANLSQFSGVLARQGLKTLGALTAIIVALAFTTASWSQNRQSADPTNLELARIEARALSSDLTRLAEDQGKPSITKCGFHKRSYTFVSEYEDARGLTAGRFTGLVKRRLPEARAEFFLDPWNSPYWIRDRCDRKKGRRVVFVYSFGPNRSRESSRWEILGDDIGEYVLVEP